jgi:hypothetical protein
LARYCPLKLAVVEQIDEDGGVTAVKPTICDSAAAAAHRDCARRLIHTVAEPDP